MGSTIEENQHDRHAGEGADPMSAIYDPPISAGPGQQLPPPWFGPGDPGGPGDPPGYGGGEGPSHPTRRLRRGLLAAGVAGAVGLAAFWGLSAAGITSGSKVLTTPQIA